MSRDTFPEMFHRDDTRSRARSQEYRDEELRPRRMDTRDHWKVAPERRQGIIVNHAGTYNGEITADCCFFCDCPVSEHAQYVLIKNGKRLVVDTPQNTRRKTKTT